MTPTTAPAALPELPEVENFCSDTTGMTFKQFESHMRAYALAALSLNGTPGSVAESGGESTGPVVGGAALAQQPKAEPSGWLVMSNDGDVVRFWSRNKNVLDAFLVEQGLDPSAALAVYLDPPQPRPPVDHGIPTDEAGMREYRVPTFESADDLASFIASLINRNHDYGTCVYAMSLAATAAFNHVAKRLGVTGYQASCADMDVLRRTRNIEGPFMLIDGANALFPQYDLKAKLDEFLTEIQPWLKEQAQVRLKKDKGAAPRVVEHWQRLAQSPQEH